MTSPRGLSASEAALWRQLAATVTPLPGRKPKPNQAPPAPLPSAGEPESSAEKANLPPSRTPPPATPRPRDLTEHGLDASWERKLAKAQIAPDLTIDLHGHGLDAAHTRLMGALAQASASGARLLLVIAGKARPHGENDVRGQRRGAIRAKLLDWLAASPHAARIAAIRPAHPRHGGAGAVYVVLRRAR